MIEHIDRVEQIFTEAGIKFTRLKSEKTFEWYMFDWLPAHRRNPKLEGTVGRSWPTPKARWCTARLKGDIVDRYLKALKSEYTVIQLIGFAADETSRLERKNNRNPNHRHPLIDWGWTEADCLRYCYDLGFDWGGLYKIFHRVSCWCCPLQSLDELRNLRKHFPDLWSKLLAMDHRTWGTFRADYSVDQLDLRFAFEEERIAAGLPIGRNRDFMTELKKLLAEQNTANLPQRDSE